MNNSSIARIGTLATSVALAFGAVTATAGTAQAAYASIPCVDVHKGKVVKVDCKTGKRISDAEYYKKATKKANNGWLVEFANTDQDGVFEVALPARLQGQSVTVTAVFTSRSTPEWLDRGAQDAVSTTVRVSGKRVTVAIPDQRYDQCWSLRVTVKGETGAAVKTRFTGGGGAFTNVDNGYTQITIKP